jgi:pimeloyl-ACP methyl ester carboxylesterase
MSLESPQTHQNIIDSKFKNPEKLQVEGGSVFVVDLQPEKTKTETPLILVPGWAATANVLEKNARLLARDRRVLAISSPHGITPSDQENTDAPLAELRKAESVLKVLDAKGIEKADVIAHSEGAIFVTAAALKNPERFRNIVLYAPAGLIGEDSFWELALRFNADILTQLSQWRKEPGRAGRIGTALLEGSKAIASGPIRSLEEVKAIATSQIQNDLRELHDKGIGIVIMHPAGDKAFPMNRMSQMVDGKMVDGFLSVGDPIAWVAQLVEHLPEEEGVAGSIPAPSTYDHAFRRETLEETNIDIDTVPWRLLGHLAPKDGVSLYMQGYEIKLDSCTQLQQRRFFRIFLA